MLRGCCRCHNFKRIILVPTVDEFSSGAAQFTSFADHRRLRSRDSRILDPKQRMPRYDVPLWRATAQLKPPYGDVRVFELIFVKSHVRTLTDSFMNTLNF